MALTTTVAYSTSTGFTFSTTALAFSASAVQLFTSGPTSSFNQPFTTSTGFGISGGLAFSAGSVVHNDANAAVLTLPRFTNSGASISTITSLTVTTANQTHEPRYIINVSDPTALMWYDSGSSSWVSSNDTVSQANTKAVFNAHIGEFSAAGAMLVDFKIWFGGTTAGTEIDDLTVNFNVTPTYVTSDPSILYDTTILSDTITSFSTVSTATGSDAIRYALEINGTDKYHDGTGWTTSNGTYSQANSAGSINTNLSSLIMDTATAVRLRAYLHSESGTTTPILTSAILTYSLYPEESTAPSECIITGYMKNLDGINQSTGTLYIKNSSHFFHGKHLVMPLSIAVSISGDGFFKTPSLIETTTISTTTTYPYNFMVRYTDDLGIIRDFTLGSALIPNTSTSELADLTFS